MTLESRALHMRTHFKTPIRLCKAEFWATTLRLGLKISRIFFGLRLVSRTKIQPFGSKAGFEMSSKQWEEKVKATRAFTLVETLVAISVLLLALVGPMSIASRGLSAAYNARDEVIAYYLAQEGIEYVRAVRDQNYLGVIPPPTPWLSGLGVCLSPAQCVVDVPNFTNTACAGACPALQVSAGGGLYNQAGGTVSPFTRTVTIVPVVGNSDEVVVRVTLSWVSGRIPRTFALEDHLFRSQ